MNDLNEELKKVKAEQDNGSCSKKEHFIKLGTGQAPTLNYNIPQSACFNTYSSHFVKGIRQEMFLPSTKVKPNNNFFTIASKLKETDLRKRFSETIQLQSNDGLIPNIHLLRKHLDTKTSNLSAVALDAQPVTTRLEKKDGTEAPLVLEAFTFDKTNAINELQLTRIAKSGFRPIITESLGGFNTKLRFLREPAKVVPYFMIIEEYRTCSYLGDYGAGKTVKTFSLLPGEKTTMTIRTYKEMSSTKAYSENVLDSFSESSTNELESLIETETNQSSQNSSESTNSSSQSHTVDVSTDAKVKFAKIVEFGVQAGYEGNFANSSTNTTTSSRSSSVKAVNKALEKHVSNSNASRSVEVNTSTTESYTQGEENITVRQLENINKSRVLNFVFRQLLQQYITITYLSNVKIAFCNGYYESLRVVEIDELDILLEDTIQHEYIEQVRQKLLKDYCTIFNYKDEEIPFIEKVTRNLGACVGLDEEETFWRVRKNITDTWRADEGGLEITVKGPILNVSTNTLRTDSVVTDALLGQGEALDCYNTKLQEADTITAQLNNIEQLQQLLVIQGISDNEKKAELYKKVFGTCCDVPQSGCNCSGVCNCGENTTDEPANE